MLRGEAAFEACVHDSRELGTFMRGDAYLAAQEAEIARQKRPASKLLAKLRRARRRESDRRMLRRAKAALREQRRLARMAEKPVPVAEAVPQKSAPPKPSLWSRVKGLFARKAA